jgi:predicted transcriptional regulator
MRKNKEKYKRGTTGRKVRLTEKDLAAIYDLHLQGRTQAETAKELGFTQPAICRAHKRLAAVMSAEERDSIKKELDSTGEQAVLDAIKRDIIIQIARQVKSTKSIRDLSISLLNIIAIESQTGKSDNNNSDVWLKNVEDELKS